MKREHNGRRGWLVAVMAVAVVAAGSVGGVGDVPEALRTVGERSGFEKTGRYAEVVAVMDALAAAAPGVARRASMGESEEGRAIPLLIMSDPPVSTAAEARALAEREGKVIVLAIGNIHAGEPDGAEALPMLAREMVLEGGAERGLLKNLIVVFAPVYNVDGTERAGEHRLTQNGPRVHGTRENAGGFDLNRDFVKVETAEGAALVGFFNAWDPHLFIDCHVTNGSLHRFVISYAGIKNPAGDAELLAFSRERFLPGVDALYEAATGEATFYYGSFGSAFSEEATERSRWGTFPAEARFGTNYVGLRNRLGLLVESYVYTPFQRRVELTREYVRHALRWAAEQSGEIRAVTKAADERAGRGEIGVIVDSGARGAKGDERAEGDDAHSQTHPRPLPLGGGRRELAVRSKAAAFEEKVTILGYEEQLEGGRPVSTGKEKEYRVEFWDRWEPVVTVDVPVAYAIVPLAEGEAGDAAKVRGRARLIAKLQQHGVEVETLTEARRVMIEPMVFARLEPASRAFQGHVLVRVGLEARGAGGREERELPAGTVLVRTAQRLGALAVYLLEPEGEDSLATWNYLDPWLEVGAEGPVWRVVGE
jgi:dipeptidyl-peptidase 4